MIAKLAWLRNLEWDLAILDEAQAIKNPGARQSRAVKELRIPLAGLHQGENAAVAAGVLGVLRRELGVPLDEEALRAGIHPGTLYTLRDSGVLEVVSRGVYRLADGSPLGNPDLATVAIRMVKYAPSDRRGGGVADASRSRSCWAARGVVSGPTS
jgi:hypothetical protein